MLLAIIASVETSRADAVEKPRIAADRVVFSNGRVVAFVPHRKVQVDSEPAAERGEPVEIDERAILVPEWERVLLLRVAKLFEDADSEVRVYDYDGDLLAPSQRFTGELRVLSPTRRLLLAQRSAHRVIAESILLDENGQIVARIPQPGTVEGIDYSRDGQLIWIISNDLRNGVLIAEVEVFDSNGRRVTTLQSEEEKTLKVTVGGKDYEIHVAKPELPG